MPPVNKQRPSQTEQEKILHWLSKKQNNNSINDYRRTSRHEFVYSVNDLLGVRLDLAENIPGASFRLSIHIPLSSANVG